MREDAGGGGGGGEDEELRRGQGSVLEQTLLGHPGQRGQRLLSPGVLQLQQVAHLTDGLQCLEEHKERSEVRGLLTATTGPVELDHEVSHTHTHRSKVRYEVLNEVMSF